MTRLACLVLVLAVPAFAAEPSRRFLLAVGTNRGLDGEETLRYAEDDAQRVRDVMVELGGVSPDDGTVLRAASATQVRAALEHLRETLSHGPRSSRLMVYVSSHADDAALHLSNSELPLAELVDFMHQAPVEVGVLVVDACRSGALTRLKGLKPAEGPPVRVEASTIQGRVVITASGADEYAQESDALEGSTFTHHLVTGLRGAADTSHDGQVTLDEVYSWAWARTLESTFASRGGVQRPSFRVDLEGQGQLVLSEPGLASRLTIAVEAPGRWLVVRADSGAVMADVEKPTGPMTLALPPGAYRARLRVEKGVLERTVMVPAVGGASLSGEDFERASLVRVALKGGPGAVVAVSAGAGVASGLTSGFGAQAGVEARARYDAPLLGFLDEATLSMAAYDGRSVAFGFRQTEVALRVGVGARFFVSRVSISLGLEVGALLVMQQELPVSAGRTGLGPLAQVVVEVRVPLIRPVELYVLGSGGSAVLRHTSSLFVTSRLAASGGLAVAF